MDIGRYRFNFSDALYKYGALIVLLIMVIVSSFLSVRFLTMKNMLVILRQVSIIGIIAIGQTYTILTGDIDLSVGSIVALSVVIIAGLIPFYGLILAILAGLVSAIAVGLVNGLAISTDRIPAFIMTLGMSSFVRGLAYIYTSGVPIQINNKIFFAFGNGYVWGIPIPVLIYVVFLFVFSFILRKTPFGRGIYAIGSSKRAAIIAGVPVKKYRIIVYLISGFCAGVGGLLYASQLSLGSPIAGELYELDAIAASVVGGIALVGGEGNLVGTFIGTLVLGVMNNILNLMAVNPFIQELFKGALIIGAVLLRRQTFDR